MKKIIIVLMFLAASQATLANEMMVIADTAKGLYRLKYLTSKVCNTRIVIKDASGNQIFDETIRNQSNFVRPYNFSQLPAGRYTIIASNAEGKTVNYIDHKQLNDERDLNFNVLKLGGSRFLLHVPGHQSKQVRVVISAGEKEIYSDILNVSDDFGCVYKVLDAEEKVSFRVTPI